ncbi:MAG: 3-phosphoshikimate 1-carboxyvinyltransferase [Planctomycetota bacterium]
MTTPEPASLETLRLPLADLPDPLVLPKWSRSPGKAPLDLRVRPPGSKSLTNRALLLAALANGTTTLRHPLLAADDAERMLQAISTLGAQVDRSEPGCVRITGVAGRWKTPEGGATVNLNNAGTATRFLTAAALCSDEPITVDGNERMRQRPIGELTDLLRRLGATVEHAGSPDCPPVTITAPKSIPGEPIEIGRTQSSQYVSALLLTAPFLPGGLTLTLSGEITSASYVRMTLELLDEVGAQVRASDDLRTIRVLEGLDAFELDVEPDASGGTYWWVAGALLPEQRVSVEGLRQNSSQGDTELADLMGRMGASVEHAGGLVSVRGPRRLSPIMANMTDMPDATLALAVVCAFADGMSVLRGVRTLRVKETDRIAALQNELGKLGVKVEDRINGDDDVMTITPPDRMAEGPVEFDTYDDHRMAMSLGLVALRREGVVIREPQCVAKTYPSYFAEFARLYEA